MREIALDTETTGLKPEEGHRIVELGAVELFNKLPTGNSFHRYFNPQRDMPKEAEAVHGLSSDFLKDKPLFKASVDEFLAFSGGSPLVIHNAAFDMKFINAEFKSLNIPAIPWDRVIDTLQLARAKFPAGPNSLDALCRRFGIDNSSRVRHGALLDAELLAEVYLELSGGRQTNLGLLAAKAKNTAPAAAARIFSERPKPLPNRLTTGEDLAHKQMVATLGEESAWRRLGSKG
jgi:DNA polymerase III subunit epsilon